MRKKFAYQIVGSICVILTSIILVNFINKKNLNLKTQTNSIIIRKQNEIVPKATEITDVENKTMKLVIKNNEEEIFVDKRKYDSIPETKFWDFLFSPKFNYLHYTVYYNFESLSYIYNIKTKKITSVTPDFQIDRGFDSQEKYYFSCSPTWKDPGEIIISKLPEFASVYKKVGNYSCEYDREKNLLKIKKSDYVDDSNKVLTQTQFSFNTGKIIEQ